MDKTIKIGLIHEGKIPPDYRVALTPQTAKRCLEAIPDLEIIAQTSDTRCYKDVEYNECGIPVEESVAECNVLLGIKEVPLGDLINNKTYFFFSHTIKKQTYNRELLQSMVRKNITMIDYETLTDEGGKRIIGFGHFAGLVGAHNALLTYGLKTDSFQLRPAHQCYDYAEMKEQYQSLRFPNFKIAITGGGNVVKGAVDIMKDAGIREVSVEEFMQYTGNTPCYAVFGMESLYVNDNKGFDKKEFYAQPEIYRNNFLPVTEIADILINGIFWKASIPKLFEKEDIKNPDWSIKVIADITCDPFGSVPINLGVSTIKEPVYGIHRETIEKVQPFSNTEDTVDVMAVDNLPNELGRDASQYFSERFEKYILPELFSSHSDILERATICRGGRLTERYSYLQDFINEKN